METVTPVNRAPRFDYTVDGSKPVRILIVQSLSNRKRVGNFSSPHDFKFTGGTILPAVHNEEAERLKVTFVESLHENELYNIDVTLSFKISQEILDEMEHWMRLWRSSRVDVVLCPLPMLQGLKESGYDIVNSPFRAVRIEDRINKLVSITKQCLA